ncbi:protein DCL homolog, chloroplastic [Cajanus cajan]|uniref:protein DCL homolog, chloroplastic n=1 Tax=Cajanus cajan TaxID=3821 RepID=UPI00098D79D0|nr:protein DCL homolog, chloroplastic [Cajanus cajan]
MAARHILLHRLRWRSFQGSTAAAPQSHRLWCSATSSPEEPNSNASCGTHTCSQEYLEWKEKEEKIVRDIQPIVSLTRNILYSPRYMNGEHLSMEDERAVVENVLIYHPHYEDKIGSGLNSIMMYINLMLFFGDVALCNLIFVDAEYPLPPPFISLIFDKLKLRIQLNVLAFSFAIFLIVDHHPLYLYPRCLFVVRTDGSWIDFSYRVCLEEYIKNKYQISAERFVNKRFLKNLIKHWGI